MSFHEFHSYSLTFPPMIEASNGCFQPRHGGPPNYCWSVVKQGVLKTMSDSDCKHLGQSSVGILSPPPPFLTFTLTFLLGHSSSA